MAETKDHLIGLLLGAEEDWPQAFEQILRFVGPLNVDGTDHRIASERLTIEPFDLADPVRTGLVIDRLFARIDEQTLQAHGRLPTGRDEWEELRRAPLAFITRCIITANSRTITCMMPK